MKSALKLLLVATLIMLIVPGGYRIWSLVRGARSGELRVASLNECLEKASVDHQVRLLETPVAKWSERDKRLAGEVLAYLRAHADVVLPWEWSAEARAKDPQGFRASWESVLAEAERAVRAMKWAAQFGHQTAAAKRWFEQNVGKHFRKEGEDRLSGLLAHEEALSNVRAHSDQILAHLAAARAKLDNLPESNDEIKRELVLCIREMEGKIKGKSETN